MADLEKVGTTPSIPMRIIHRWAKSYFVKFLDWKSVPAPDDTGGTSP
jgi:hypothetical protein